MVKIFISKLLRMTIPGIILYEVGLDIAYTALNKPSDLHKV